MKLSKNVSNKYLLAALLIKYKDLELQQALRLGRHKELNEAVIYALECEAAKEASQYIPNLLYM